MDGSREAIERAKRAACSIRSTTDEEVQLEQKLSALLAPLTPDQRISILSAMKNLAIAGRKARRSGVPAAVLLYEGLREAMFQAHARIYSGEGDPMVNAQLVHAIHEKLEALRSEYDMHVIYDRKIQRERDAAERVIAGRDRELARRRRGELALRPVNESRRARRIAEEDRSREDVERRIRAGKTLQQIATFLGWSKTKVHGAVKRWGLTGPGLRKRSGQ